MAAKLEGIPILDGWVNLTEASEILGTTRQHSYKMASRGHYKTLHQIGSKPAYVVSTKELQEILKAKADAAAAKDSAE